MYLQFAPSIVDRNNSGAEVEGIMQDVRDRFPTKGKAIFVEKDQLFIYLNMYGKFDREQFEWIKKQSYYDDDFSWGVGGTIVLPNQRVTADTFSSEWEIKVGKIAAKFGVITQIGTFLHVNGFPSKKNYRSDAELYAALKEYHIPLDGWTQRIELCQRCDGPGAGQGYFYCPSCEEALAEFKAAPMRAWRESNR